MDFLNQTWQSLNALLRELTPGTRLLAGLLLLAVVVSLAYLVRFQTGAPDEYLLGGRAFSSGELAAIEAAFAQKKLGNYEIRGPQVRVPRGQRAVYVAAMAEAGALPPDAFTFLTEAVANSGMFESDETRRQKMNVANQQLLSHVISEMQGIGEATVQFREVVRDRFRRQTEMTAMVAVRPEGAAHLEEEQVRTIRDTVAAAIGGRRDNITITDLNAGRSFTGSGADGLPAAIDDPYAQRKRMYERDWQAKIAARLAHIPGVVVGVNVELDPQWSHSEQSLTYNKQPVTIESESQQQSHTSSAADPGGRPGVGSNLANSPETVAAAAPRQNTGESTTERVRNAAGHDVIARARVGLVPERVSASIGVPRSYFERVWREQHPTPPGEEPAAPDQAELLKIEQLERTNIENTVVRLLPKAAPGTTNHPEVQVTTYQDLRAEPAPTPDRAAEAGAWLAGNWQTLAMLGVGLVSLLMLRGMLKAPAAEPEGGSPLPASLAEGAGAPGEQEEEEEEVDAEPARRRPPTPGRTIRDDVVDFVRSEPEVAAHILKKMIA